VKAIRIVLLTIRNSTAKAPPFLNDAQSRSLMPTWPETVLLCRQSASRPNVHCASANVIVQTIPM
jgi:hypothetical protein